MWIKEAKITQGKYFPVDSTLINPCYSRYQCSSYTSSTLSMYHKLKTNCYCGMADWLFGKFRLIFSKNTRLLSITIDFSTRIDIWLGFVLYHMTNLYCTVTHSVHYQVPKITILLSIGIFQILGYLIFHIYITIYIICTGYCMISLLYFQTCL